MTRHLVASALALGLAFGIARADDGAPAVYESKCKVCHSIGGEGGKLASKGGPLDGVGAKRDEAWLRAYLADPKGTIPDAKMPNMKLAPSDIDALVAYLLTLK